MGGDLDEAMATYSTMPEGAKMLDGMMAVLAKARTGSWSLEKEPKP
jgi:hypothetical protein